MSYNLSYGGTNTNKAHAQTLQLPSSFGPQYVVDIGSIHKQLGCFTLTSAQILMMAKDALLYGSTINNNLYIHNQYCHQIIHQNLIFVLSHAFDAVVTIHGTNQYFTTSTTTRQMSDIDIKLSEKAMIDE